MEMTDVELLDLLNQIGSILRALQSQVSLQSHRIQILCDEIKRLEGKRSVNLRPLDPSSGAF